MTFLITYDLSPIWGDSQFFQMPNVSLIILSIQSEPRKGRRKEDLQIMVTADSVTSLCGLLDTRHSKGALRILLQRIP